MAMCVSRRTALLASAATLLGAAAKSAATLAQTSPPADRIWTGGPILTMNDRQMRAEAVAERAGRIVAVGSTEEVMRLRGPATQVVNLAGRCLIPGFVDPHGHIVFGGLQALSANLLSPPDGEVTDIPSLQRTLAAWLAANQEAVRRANLIVGFGYDNSQLKELRHPTRDELDAVSRDIPIVIVHQSSHLGVMNSKALAAVGFDAATPEIPGGVIRRRPGSKEPDGVLEETAFMAGAFKLLGGIGPSGVRAVARAGAQMWARFGYTTVQEGRALPAVAEAVKAVAAEGGFKNDVAVYVDVQSDRDYILKNHSRAYVNRMRIAGAKLSSDGSPQGFTAFRDRPYYNPVGNYPPGYLGYATLPLGEAIGHVEWAFQNNVHLLNHCNGEAASDMFITALKVATAKHGPADRRPVLIHGQFLREEQIDAFKEYGVFPSLFPMHTFYWGDWHRDHTVGPLLADNISPTGWVRQRGMMFSSHHDAPVALPDSMRVLAATVTRRTRSGDILGPHQRVDVITALKAMTLWPAYQQFEDDQKGSIEVGKLADLVILSGDPTTVNPERLSDLTVIETIKDGETIFRQEPGPQKRGSLAPGPVDEPFQRFINTASVYHDALRAANPLLRSNPAMMKAMSTAPNDRGCVHRFLFEVLSEAANG